MNLIPGFAHHTGIRLAEAAFLLMLFAGVWLAAAQVPQFKFASGRTIVAGVAFALAVCCSSSQRTGATSASSVPENRVLYVGPAGRPLALPMHQLSP